MPQTSYHVTLNASAGAAASMGLAAANLRDRFAALGAPVELDGSAYGGLAERLAAARASTAPVLVAAGGDGTVTALAQVALETGKTLAILPLGTANLLARDLDLPLELDDWFAGLDAMVPRRIDVGEVNGRIFLHKVVVGVMPQLAAGREHVRGRAALSAKLGLLMYFVRRLSRMRRFAAEVARDGGPPHIERVQSIAIANNGYDAAPGRIFARSRLDGGRLSLYLLRQLGVIDALRLGLEMAMGSWREDPILEIEDATSVVVRTRGRRVRAMVDGEIEMLEGPLIFRSRPQALTVLAPPVAEPATEAAADLGVIAATGQ